jgi:flavodoxin
MRITIIYVSIHHGNTEKIAREIARVLDAEFVDVGKANEEMIKDSDLIGFGSGIYFGKHHTSLLKFIDALPQMNKKVFIFSTRGGGPPFIYHRAIKKKLREKGFEIVGEFSCKGLDTFGLLKYIGGINKGRPDEKDLRKAREFAEKVRKVFSL